jgi:hypothetical protein
LHQETRPGEAVRFSVAIDLGKRGFWQRDIDPHRARRFRRQWNQDRHAIAVRRFGHDLFERGGLWDRFAVGIQSLDMERERFLGIGAGLVQRRARRNAAGKSGNETPNSLSGSL